MNTRNKTRIENLLYVLGAYSIPIEKQAKESADTLISEGWDVDGDSYELGSFPGAAEALRERMGHKPSPYELRILESCIRVHLDDASETIADEVTS